MSPSTNSSQSDSEHEKMPAKRRKDQALRKNPSYKSSGKRRAANVSLVQKKKSMLPTSTKSKVASSRRTPKEMETSSVKRTTILKKAMTRDSEESPIEDNTKVSNRTKEKEDISLRDSLDIIRRARKLVEKSDQDSIRNQQKKTYGRKKTRTLKSTDIDSDISEITPDYSSEVEDHSYDNMHEMQKTNCRYTSAQRQQLHHMAGHSTSRMVSRRRRHNEILKVKLEAAERKKYQLSTKEKGKKYSRIEQQDEEIAKELHLNKERRRKIHENLKRKHTSSSSDESVTSQSVPSQISQHTKTKKRKVRRKSEIDLDQLQIQWEKKVREDPLKDIEYRTQDFITDESDEEEVIPSEEDSSDVSPSEIERGSRTESISSSDEEINENESEGNQSMQEEQKLISETDGSNKEVECMEISQTRSHHSTEQDTHERRHRGRTSKIARRSAYDPEFDVPETVTVDYYGVLRIPGELRSFDYEADATSFRRVTGWERIDDFRYMFCLSVEPPLSRAKGGRWIRFAKIMESLGSDRTNQNCFDHVSILLLFKFMVYMCWLTVKYF